MAGRVAATIVTLLLAAGCGGGGAASGPAKTHLSAADSRLATVMLIRASDVGPGWTETRSHDSDHDDPCRVARGDLTVTGAPDGTELEHGQGVDVLSDATVFQSESQARDAFDRASDRSFVDCFARRLERRLGAAKHDMRFGHVRVADLSARTAGDESRGYRLRIPVHANGLGFTIYLDMHVIRRGRGVGLLGLFSPLRPFDGGLGERLRQRMGSGQPSAGSTA